MLRIYQNNSAAGAKNYYSKAADYYSEGQELVGQWRGEGAKRLGLAGVVRRETWDALCDNRNPATGETLTLRQKQNRRIGYDFNFHVPKSVSVLYSLTKDDRILDAFRESVGETMCDMEAEMQTRVRKDGQNGKRTTGNILYGEFVHFTARPVGGVPDPHLHAHCFVFNMTWDKKEAAWKAGEFAGLKRDAPYFEAKFHSRMARKMAGLGIAVERSKTGWEIAGIPKSAIRQFSRRTALIEKEALRRGIVDPAAKAELGAKTREHKKKDLTIEQLRSEWASRLSEGERVAVAAVGKHVGGRTIGEDAKAPDAAVRHAMEHWFERKSVVPERTLLAEAMKHAIGKASPEAIEAAYQRQEFVVGEQDGRRMATTREVLKEEMRMISYARGGRGTEAKLSDRPHAFTRDWLNEGQRRAVLHVLASRDKVILVNGSAGVGKTTMMQEAVEAIQAGGKRVFTFAPSAEASRGVLRSEGFKNADTVARLLIDERLHEKLKGQVVWIDEAGLLGTKTMARVFDLAEKLDTRVVCCGDRYQHGAVERGAALRLLEEEAGLIPAEIKDIMRQKGAYKLAVQALSDGRTEEGFRQLDALGWVREVADDDRYRVLAKDYVATVAAGKSALVISPTHREGEKIMAEIRSELKKIGRLTAEQRPVLQLQNANLTEAQRTDEVNYLPGDVLEYHQNAKGIRKGQRLVAGQQDLPLGQAAKFQAYHAGELRLAPGDLVRITKNGLTADGRHRLNNGARFAVEGFSPSGDLVLDNGWTVSKDYGHWAYGYCSTSHASQGKTADHVLIGQSAESFPASSREQFYVSVSRGRRATLYTNDKAALLAAVSRSDDRLAATEFVNKRARVSVLQREESLVLASPERTTRDHERKELEHER
jgi:conjugative relaxase-like TrwC/TraI family protein